MRPFPGFPLRSQICLVLRELTQILGPCQSNPHPRPPTHTPFGLEALAILQGQCLSPCKTLLSAPPPPDRVPSFCPQHTICTHSLHCSSWASAPGQTPCWGLGTVGQGWGAPLINSYPIRCQEYPSSSVPPDKSPSTCQATSRAPSLRSPPCRLRAELSPPCPGSAPSPCVDTLSQDRDHISLSSVTLAASQGLVQMTCPGRVWGMTKW